MLYGRQYPFPDSNGGFLPYGYNKWIDEQRIHVHFNLIEFIANVKNTKNGVEIMPTKMKRYILGIQRGFNQQWGYDHKLLSGKVFNCPNTGLASVLNNKARRLQDKRNHTQHFNVFSKEELLLLFNSKSRSIYNSKRVSKSGSIHSRYSYGDATHCDGFFETKPVYKNVSRSR